MPLVLAITAQHRDMGRRDVVDADQRADIAEGREQVALGRDVGADIGQRLDPEAEEFAVLVERQLGVADIVAGVLVGLDRLAALAGPFDRPAQFLRRQQHQPVLGILPALGAEPAADIAGDDPDPAFRDLEDARGERLAHAVRVLHIGIEGEALLARVPHADRAARLHEMRIDPADDVAPLDDMRAPWRRPPRPRPCCRPRTGSRCCPGTRPTPRSCPPPPRRYR